MWVYYTKDSVWIRQRLLRGHREIVHSRQHIPRLRAWWVWWQRSRWSRDKHNSGGWRPRRSAPTRRTEAPTSPLIAPILVVGRTMDYKTKHMLSLIHLSNRIPRLLWNVYFTDNLYVYNKKVLCKYKGTISVKYGLFRSWKVKIMIATCLHKFFTLGPPLTSHAPPTFFITDMDPWLVEVHPWLGLI